MTQLRRKLTLYGLTMIAVGSCIGSGIFITPNEIAGVLGHPSWIIIVWLLGGIIALTGALTFAELGGLFPKSGGVYVFLKEAYGPLAGFLYGWMILLVINTGALAALGVAFAEYLKFFIPGLSANDVLIVAASTVIILTAINCLGVNISQWLSNIFTGGKLLAILVIIVIGFAYIQPHAITLEWSLGRAAPSPLHTALLTALIGVLWSFGGWHHTSYLAGEAIEPQRTIPRAMILGTGIVTVTYVLVNMAYLFLLPIPAIAGTERVAGDALAVVIPWGGQLVAVFIAISIFGTVAIYTMSAPRIYYAMAKDGLFFSALAKVHPKYGTPVNAMVVQAVWALVLLIAWGTFSNLITYVTFMDICFMAMAGASIFIFRKRLPQQDRPYRTHGYPIVPAIFIFICVAFVINTLIARPTQAYAGLILLLSGVLFYYVFKKRA
ncbi:MAG: amino acid permease [Saprospiraceae bacterium]|nr:amino acid permease [Saprospiraceae bacterium]